jgi:Fe-S-cluster-containing dehydrogenase component
MYSCAVACARVLGGVSTIRYAELSPQVEIPSVCRHCADAPCVDVCPVKASYYRDDGIVMMDYDRCIGCRYCETACPYEARSFNWRDFDGPNPAVPEWGQPEVERRPRGVVEKCSFCYQRIDRVLAGHAAGGCDATPACRCVPHGRGSSVT